MTLNLTFQVLHKIFGGHEIVIVCQIISRFTAGFAGFHQFL
jgi:hypothetical protein